jgi:uncharacterized protein
MNYKDQVYGKVEITEPVILELINCPALLRLRGIEQQGYFEPYFPNTTFSRYEHSVGDYLLLSRYNASLEERVAGLIHDVSHSAFSHCIDYMMGSEHEKNQGHQDSVFEEFVRNSEIPEILEKHSLDTDYVLNEDNFPLKERDLPCLCADRLDYSLRSAVKLGLIESGEPFLSKLHAEDNRWVFEDFESAHEYAKLFMKLNTVYFSCVPSAIMLRTVGEVLKHARTMDYISQEDLYTNDEKVLKKIRAHLEKDPDLAIKFRRMNNEAE